VTAHDSAGVPARPAASTQDIVTEKVNEFLDDRERLALERAGYGGRVGLGTRPALLVVDATWAFIGDDPTAEVEDAVRRYPHACGRTAWDALPATRLLVEAARQAEVPLFFTRGASRPADSSTRWSDKNARYGTAPAEGGEIVPASGYVDGDIVIEKECPSAFFGTPLLRRLIAAGVDSVVVCGGTTSGCVRATVVDAFSYNLRVAVADDATFDRVRASHRIALFDMDLKYADVAPAAVLAERLGASGKPPGTARTMTSGGPNPEPPDS
jgi:maleamate amidohydrolase